MGLSYISDKLERSPTVSCNKPYGFFSTKKAKQYTSPEKLVVQPWRGQHQVYAVFKIPKGYQHEYLFRLKLPGEATRCGGLVPIEKSVSTDISNNQEYYLVQGYLNTRIALNLIAKGKINDLKQAENWQLGYVKQ
ncbi:hypothetical protein H6G18_19080 [Anabaena subtropica FACHB-260]|uniref:Uncharacterized protein n=2 Tax=Anabaena TaxID=1163 RepID=A0ABR8CSP9_9NOST|nr:hypothetical protein [Anabaena subtropica FACHB-260]